VLVTPYIVRAVAQKDLSRPDDGFAAASDPQADLLGNINRIYGVPGQVEPARNYRGTYGFITGLRRDEDDNDDSQNTRRSPSRLPHRRSAPSALAVALGACTHTDEAR